MTANIQSVRLDLVPLAPDFLRASLDHDVGRASHILQASLPPDWPGEYERHLKLRLEQLEADPGLQPWLVRGMRLRETGDVVGTIGFHGRPGVDYPCEVAGDAAELGFSVSPEHRRNGYAREAAVAMMRWAAEQHGVADFVLTIRPDNLASQALARGLGFVRRGIHIDDIDGEEDVLERHGAP